MITIFVGKLISRKLESSYIYLELILASLLLSFSMHQQLYSPFSYGLHEVKGGARVIFEDEFGAAEEREVLCESQHGRIRVKRKLFGSFRNKIGNEPILALPEGSDYFVVMREARLGCVPRRKEKVIVYTTQQLEIHMENDTTHIMDLGVVVLP
nr:putative reverse transcriptase domain-containing protein [Tanacetum cinerariifolium]